MSDAIIQQLHRGDEQSWKSFYQQFYPTLLWYALKLTSNKMVSEEIVNESFIKFFNATTHKYNKQHENFLYAITRNACIDYLRRLKRERMHLKSYCSFTENSEEIENLAEMELEHIRLVEFVYGLIQRQPPKRRKAVEFYYLKEMRLKDIAVLLNIHPSVVYKHLEAFKQDVQKKAKITFGSIPFL